MRTHAYEPQAASGRDKTVTIEVPEERVAEFYAFFGRFLAGGERRRRGPGGRHGHGHGPGGHRCGPGPRGRWSEQEREPAEAPAPEASTTPPPAADVAEA